MHVNLVESPRKLDDIDFKIMRPFFVCYCLACIDLHCNSGAYFHKKVPDQCDGISEKQSNQYIY